MFKKFLVPIDGSQTSFRALETAADMAKAVGGELIVIHVVPREQQGGPAVARTGDHRQIAQGNLWQQLQVPFLEPAERLTFPALLGKISYICKKR